LDTDLVGNQNQGLRNALVKALRVSHRHSRDDYDDHFGDVDSL